MASEGFVPRNWPEHREQVFFVKSPAIFFHRTENNDFFDEFDEVFLPVTTKCLFCQLLAGGCVKINYTLIEEKKSEL